MSRRLRVYVAGPLGSGDVVAENVARAAEVGVALARAGYAPLVPHLNAYSPGAFDTPYETWMEVYFAWVRSAHVVLRLPGESTGADREVALARDLCIPVLGSVAELERRFPVGLEVTA